MRLTVAISCTSASHPIWSLHNIHCRHSQNESAPADMDFRLFSLAQAPTTLPVWELIRNDLGDPPAPRIAKTLGVGVSTVHRWNKAGRAPKLACLALFWLTRWGRSEVHTQATNDAILAAQLARSLREERDRLRAQLEDLTHARGTCPSDGQSRTDMDRVASSAVHTALMALLPLLAPVRPGALGRPVPPLDFPPVPGVDPGTPAARPPEAHSARSQDSGCSDRPPLSGHPTGERSGSASSTSSGVGVTMLPPCHHSAHFPPVLQHGEGFAAAAPSSLSSAAASPPTPSPASTTAGTRPDGSQGAQEPPSQGYRVTRVVDGRVIERREPEVARAAGADSQLRGLNGPFPGACWPQTPAPGAPSP